MFNIIKSYWMRTKRTPLRVVFVLCPLVFTCLFSLYISMSKAIKGLEMAYFFLAYIILASFSISFFIPMIYDSDRKAGAYANDLRCGIGRRKLFFGRFLFIFILLLFVELMAGIPFLLFLKLYGIPVKLVDFSLYIIISLLSLMPIIPLYQFLSIQFNYSASILSGGILTLAAILLGTTNLGDGIWYCLPFVYPVKLTVIYAEGVFSTNDFVFFFILLLFLSIMTLLLCSFWYNRWNGISQMEE